MPLGPVREPLMQDADIFFDVNVYPKLKRFGAMYALKVRQAFIKLGLDLKRVWLNSLYLQLQYNLPITCEPDEATWGVVREKFPRKRKSTIDKMFGYDQYRFIFEFRKEK